MIFKSANLTLVTVDGTEYHPNISQASSPQSFVPAVTVLELYRAGGKTARMPVT